MSRTRTTLELELVRLQLNIALENLDGSVTTMSAGLKPTLTIPLARQAIVKARGTLDAVLDVLLALPQAGEQEQP